MRNAKLKTVDRQIDVLNDVLLALVDSSDVESARRIVKFKLPPALVRRVRDLFERHNNGDLSEAELFEYGTYVKFSTRIAILQSEARMLLKSNETR